MLDNWVSESPLAQVFLDIFAVSLNQGDSIVECWNAEQNAWDLGFLRGLFERELANWANLVQSLDLVVLGEAK